MSAMTKLKYPDTLNDMVAHLKAKLPPDTDDDLIRQRADVALEVNRLKREKNAIILGHNYMAPSLYHSVPDYTGDSLGLSRIAAQSEADIIVFCGVRFMAETAKILNPDRTVLLPSAKGGCSLAEAITGQDVRELRQQYPDTPVASSSSHSDVPHSLSRVVNSQSYGSSRVLSSIARRSVVTVTV